MLEARKYFDDHITTFPGTEAVQLLRQDALELGEKIGLPTRHLEAWHYTDLPRLLARKLKATEAKDTANFQGMSPYQICFGDGPMEVSDALLNEAKVKITPIDQALNETQFAAFKKADMADSDAMSAYNLALLQAGIKIEILENLEHPIVLQFAANKSQHIRNEFIVREGVKADLIEHITGSAFMNYVADMQCDASSQLNHFRLQECGQFVSLGRMMLDASATLSSQVAVLGGDLARHELRCAINGTRAEANLTGLVFAHDQMHVDLTSVIDHRVADTNSQTLVRTILQDEARAVFQGKIIVERDAQRVDAQQKSDALMLSRRAEMNSKPELEIYADDVACAHGSTIGELDADALFFLRSRGIDEKAAQQMLIEGFLSVALNEIPSLDLREFVQGYLAEFLANSDLIAIEVAS
jgi:Fe-S cluster assembly protein SufD